MLQSHGLATTPSCHPSGPQRTTHNLHSQGGCGVISEPSCTCCQVSSTDDDVLKFLSWNYIAVGSDGGQLPGGGTYLTYISADRQNFTIVLETMTLEVIHI